MRVVVIVVVATCPRPFPIIVGVVGVGARPFYSFVFYKLLLPRAQENGNSMSLSRFQNPKIHSDLLQIFREFFGVHRNRGKYLRITVLEKEILEKLTACMRVTIEINTMKNKGGEAVLFEKTSTIRAQPLRWILSPHPSQIGRSEQASSGLAEVLSGGWDAGPKSKTQKSSFKLQVSLSLISDDNNS